MKMLVEGEGASQNGLDSCRGHLLVGSPIMVVVLVVVFVVVMSQG